MTQIQYCGIMPEFEISLRDDTDDATFNVEAQTKRTCRYQRIFKV